MEITVQGKSYPLQWGMGAIEIYCDMMDCDIDGLSMVESGSPLEMQKAISTLVFAAAKNGCEVKDVTFDLTMPKLKARLDEMEQEKFGEIMQDFTNSKYLGKTMLEHLTSNLSQEDLKKNIEA